ncbi:MAG TPA: lytic murein transglycosylase [Micromonosporaceae bacterium]
MNGDKPALRSAVPPATDSADTAREQPNHRWPARLKRLPAAAGRTLLTWARGPQGRLALPGLLLLAVVSASGSAGALLVPAAGPRPAPTATAADDPDLDLAPSAPADPGYAPEPTGTTTPAAGSASGRPSDPLAGWAQQVGARVGIPPAALQAYGYAEWVLGQTEPGCQLRWTTLAAIGKVESDHGRFGGASIGPDGTVQPSIVGLPLDGRDDRKLIADTDGGRLDGDQTYDRAVGPMQFIPGTWQQDGVDADGDGVKNPHDMDDAALAAGRYLCKGGRDLAKPQDWWKAILSYNNVQSYAQQVFDTANRYGVASHG